MRGRSGTFVVLALGALAAGAALASDVAPRPVPLVVPAPQTMPDGPLGDAVRQGLSIINATKTALPGNVGNGLQCASCHLNGGTVAYAAPLVGVWGVYPEYFARSGRVEGLADRINDCFRRSMNGKPIDIDGEPMRALMAYVAWLSTGVPTGTSVVGRGFRTMPPPASPPDAGRGATLYEQRCASCHGADGGGAALPSGGYSIPPLWGPQSFNDGAGMSHIATAAAFIQAKMPLGRGGSLSDQDAWDIAALVTGAPRPAFAGKTGDFPKGGRPAVR
ncbi:MAG TPA: c-type cytochrome [Casimicrobiaceae bacterium]|nr:c-type cytochrome [Casimicrobiaceae bacterium]